MRKKILIFIFVIGTVVIIFMTLLVTGINHVNLLKSTTEENEDIVHALSKNLDNYLIEITNTVKTMATAPLIMETLIERNNQLEMMSEYSRDTLIDELNNQWMKAEKADDPFIKQYTSNETADFLKKQQKTIPDWYGEIFLTNKFGELVASTGKLTTLAHRQKYWWQACHNDGKGRVFFDDRGFDESVEGYVIGVVVPVYDDDEIIGILKCNINIMSFFDQIIEDYHEIYAPGDIKIVRTGGLVVYDLDTIPLTETLSEEYMLDRVEETTITIYDKNNKRQIVSISPVHNTLGSDKIGFGGKYESIDHIQGNTGESWSIVYSMLQRNIFLDAFKDTWQYIFISIIIFIALFLITNYISKRMTQPLKKLRNFTEEIGRGNYDTHIELHTNDEIEILADSFNNMVSNLKRTTASKIDLENEIIKREKMEKKNARLQAHLREQQKLESIGVLASGVAHEINNPLNGILNYTQLILDMAMNRDEECETSREDVEEYSNEIINETQRISVIVKKLLQFSRNDKQEFSKSSISNIIDSTLSLVKTIVKHDQIELVVDIPKNLPLIECRSQQIQQVIMNLITNSKDALNQKYPGYDENKKIIISAQTIKFKKLNGIRITVEDYGNGISKDMQGRIFDPFFTTKGRTEGTGLGLSISYGIVKDHQGELTVVSEEKIFTRFFIDLPLKHEFSLPKNT